FPCFAKLISVALFDGWISNASRRNRKLGCPSASDQNLAELLASYYPVEGSNGVDRAACILHDITERKRAEQSLTNMNRKLIEAQEQERTRIGRELHDDINQRLALLVTEMEISRQNLPHSREEISQLLAQLQKRIVEVSSEVQSISHQLHSSQLEIL